MKRFKVLLIFLIVLIGITIVFFGPIILRETGKREVLKEEEKALPHPVVAAKGVVESRDEIEISSKVSGLIKDITVIEAESVKKGQTLVILDNKERRAQIKEAEALTKKAGANYEKARIDYERYERLYESDAVTLNELEEFKRRLKFAEAELLEANARLSRAKAVFQNYTLKSPINGVVTTKHLEIGETAQKGVPILTLANLEALKIRAELDETDVGKVHVGQRAEVVADAYPGRVYSGKVEKISEDVKRKRIRTFDPTAWIDINSQEITIALDSFEGLKIGMTVDVKFYPDNKAK